MIRPEDDPALLKAYHDVVTSNPWKNRAWVDGSVLRLFILDVARAAIAAEREACAKMLDDLAREARTARNNYIAIGDAERDAQRYDDRSLAYLSGADAIRARGTT